MTPDRQEPVTHRERVWPMKRFCDQVAIVTGGGHGIGLATARRLSAEGARVVVADLDSEAAVKAAAMLSGEGGEALGLRIDVTDPTMTQELVAATVEHYGRIDVLHNNAGYLRAGTALTQSVADWERTFAVNVHGIFLMCRAALPVMIENSGGAIINTASTGGLLGEAELAAYGASKGAVINLTRNLATDFAKHAIRVNCICPGWVPTGFNDPVLVGLSATEEEDLVKAQVPLSRQGTPEEMASAVAFLASQDASYITGHALVVDGGLTASS